MRQACIGIPDKKALISLEKSAYNINMIIGIQTSYLAAMPLYSHHFQEFLSVVSRLQAEFV